VLCRLIHSAWYCVLIIPAPAAPDCSAALTELVDSGECWNVVPAASAGSTPDSELLFFTASCAAFGLYGCS
jgi:hypothetical protein